MNGQQWRAERNDRTLRYAGRLLDENRFILLSADQEYAERYDGQVALLTAANLFGRMTPSVALDVPSVRIVSPLPWAGHDLVQLLLANLREADPFGYFEARPYRKGDYVLRMGTTGRGAVIHGSGWHAYIGPTPSPLKSVNDSNPIGPAMAAIIAASNVFNYKFRVPSDPVVLNCLSWTHDLMEQVELGITQPPELGNIWTVGVGSVGTAILYFLTLATRRFSSTLFDMDDVKLHNLDRSPIFSSKHLDLLKVDAVTRYFESIGLYDTSVEKCALDQSPVWQNRQQGTPDLLISAANERNVRSIIEMGYPPIQIYGTTGRNWQASVIRHTSITDPCSFCLFPETTTAPTACATGNIPIPSVSHSIDVSLPFLSFAAGAMAAAEILKLSLPGYPFSPNRVILNTLPRPRAIPTPLTLRQGCLCEQRSRSTHYNMIKDSRFAPLSRN